jgi:hypothetical protein
LRGGGVQARPWYCVASDEGVRGAVLRAFDQVPLDETDRRPKRRRVVWWVPLGGGGECGEQHRAWEGTRGCSFIVTRATIGIALHYYCHTPLRRHIERMGILISSDSSHRTRVISGRPSSTSHRK